MISAPVFVAHLIVSSGEKPTYLTINVSSFA
jgi:hypothetical protein